MPSPSPRAAAFVPPAHPDYFVQTPVSVLRCRTLTPVQKTTYDVLCSYADATGTAYLGQARLAAEVGCSERTVRDTIHSLVAVGLITLRRRGQGLTNLYQIQRIPLRGPEPQPTEWQRLPLQTGSRRRTKPVHLAAESDRTESDLVQRDQPPPAPTIVTERGGGNIIPQVQERIMADAALISRATGMTPDEAQATAEVAAASGHGPGYVAELVAYIESSPSVQNPAGCLRALVQQGKRRPPRGAGGVPPRSQRPALHPEYYRPGGKYGHLFGGRTAAGGIPIDAAAPPTLPPPPATLGRQPSRGPSAFAIAADPTLAGRSRAAGPRGQPWLCSSGARVDIG